MIDPGEETHVVFAEADERGGESRPQTPLDHSDGWERGLATATGWVGFSEGNDGGVGPGHDGP